MSSRCFSSRGCSTSPRCDEVAYSLKIGQRLCRSCQNLAGWGLGRIDARSTKGARAKPCAAATRIENSNGDFISHVSSPEELAVTKRAELDSDQAAVDTEFIAETLLPTSSGKFRLRGYRHAIYLSDGTVTLTEPSVIMTGQPEGKEEVVVRVHDACFTSGKTRSVPGIRGVLRVEKRRKEYFQALREVLGSLKCDCADQLQLAMDFIQENPGGLIIYLQQEGRGIGLANKIAAYALQEKGMDTVDANRELGLPDDAREYTSVRNILKDLGIKSIQLMTNNPRKIEVLESLGVKVTERIPCIVKAQKHNLGYLSTKRARMRHLLAPDAELDGSYCIWNHDGEPLQASVLTEARFQNGAIGTLVTEEELKSERRAELSDVQRAVAEKHESRQQEQQT